MLIKIGVSERIAISYGITSKGLCNKSKPKAINNEFLARQGMGFFSLIDRLQNYLCFFLTTACYLKYFGSNLE